MLPSYGQSTTAIYSPHIEQAHAFDRPGSKIKREKLNTRGIDNVNAPVEAKDCELTGLLYTPQVGSRGLLTTL